MFRRNALTLVSTSRWDDPFENQILDTFTELSDVLERRRSLVGQCWSMTPESDAMWRIYAPAKNGVRITSTPRRLIEHASKLNDGPGTLAIIKVSYLERGKARSQIHRHLREATADQHILVSASIKRQEFEHENEVRLLYLPSRIAHDQIVHLKTREYQVCLDLLFDPRMTDDEFFLYERFFHRRNFSGALKRSKLYSL